MHRLADKHAAVSSVAGEGEQDENDNFVEQLNMNAEAAVAALRERGVSDHRLAVGGHSYVSTPATQTHRSIFCAPR